MTRADQLNIRARQILGDTTLPLKDQVQNSASLLRQLRENVHDDPAMLDTLLGEISDLTVREKMRAALA